MYEYWSNTCSTRSVNTFSQQHLQTILKLMPFIDGSWLNSTYILVLTKNAISINGTFLFTDLNDESDSMPSNVSGSHKNQCRMNSLVFSWNIDESAFISLKFLNGQLWSWHLCCNEVFFLSLWKDGRITIFLKVIQTISENILAETWTKIKWFSLFKMPCPYTQILGDAFGG